MWKLFEGASGMPTPFSLLTLLTQCFTANPSLHRVIQTAWKLGWETTFPYFATKVKQKGKAENARNQVSPKPSPGMICQVSLYLPEYEQIVCNLLVVMENSCRGWGVGGEVLLMNLVPQCIVTAQIKTNIFSISKIHDVKPLKYSLQ